MLMQWMLPPPHRISLAGAEYTFTLSPKAAWIAFLALHTTQHRLPCTAYATIPAQ